MTELLRYSYAFAGGSDHEQSLFDALPDGLSPYLTKKPADTIRIGRAFERDDQLYVVALVRDPRAVVTSVHWSQPDTYFVGFARWLAYAEVIKRYASHPRCLVVRYESLLEDPATEQDRVDAHLPFLERRRRFDAYPEGIETLHHHATKALNGVRPFETERVAAWREHLGRVAAEVRANPEFTRSLIEFGYEPDDSWLAELEGIAPSGSSYKDGTERGLNKLDVQFRYWLKTRRYLRQRRAG